MSLNLTRGLEVKGKYSNIDYLYGPYNSPAQAKVKIPESQRGIGLTVGVIVDGKVIEYWWQKGTTDSDLVLKNLGQTIWEFSYEISSQEGISFYYDTHGHKFSELQAMINSGNPFMIKMIDNVDGFGYERLQYVGVEMTSSQYLFAEKSFLDLLKDFAYFGGKVYNFSEGENDSIVIQNIQEEGIFSIYNDQLRINHLSVEPIKVLTLHANVVNGVTRYQLEDGLFTFQDFQDILDKYSLIYIVARNEIVGDVSVFRYTGRTFLDGLEFNPNENPPYQFTGVTAIDFGSVNGGVVLLQVHSEARTGFVQGVNQDIYFKLSPLSVTYINSDYVSPLGGDGVAPGDSFDEAFRKIEQYILEHPTGGGGEEEEESQGGGDTPPVVKPIKLYYGGSNDRELDVETEYTSFGHTTNSSVSNRTLLKYYYVLVRGNSNIRVVTNNNEPITDWFINDGTMTIDNTSYKIFKFHLDTDLTYNLTINITIT